MEKQIPKKQRLHKNILFLGFVSLLNDLSSEMITPVLPLLIYQIGGLRDSIAQIFQFIFGYLSDRFKNRKILIFSGYTTSALAKLLLAFAHSWYFLLFCVGWDRIGKAMRDAPRDALLTLSTPKNLGLAFGIHKAFDCIGAILGSIFTLVLIALWKINIPTIIFISFFFGIAATLPLYFVKDIQTNLLKEPSFHFFRLSKELRTFIFIHSVFLFADFSYMFFIIHAHNTISSSYTFLTPIMLYILYNFFYTLFAAPFGILSDGINRWRVLFIGYIFFGVTCFGFYYAKTILMFVPLFCMYGIAHACTKVVARSMVSDLSWEQQRATALGAFETLGGFSSLITGLVIGIMWESLPHKFIFLASSGLVVLACCLLLVFKKKLQSTAQDFGDF
jgi:MFS family permease